MATQQANPESQTQFADLGGQAHRQRTSNADLLALVIENGQRENYAKQIVEAELVRDAFDQDWRLAKIFAMSGVFADIAGQTEQQGIAAAMAKIQLGRSWGLTPGDAMQFVYFTNGRPAVMNEIIAIKARDAGYDWDIDWHQDEKKKCVGCTLWLKKRDASGEFRPVLDRNGAPVSEAFTKADADAAKIWEKGKQISLSEKWNFVSWARDMYFWRAMGRLKKFHIPDILRGARSIEEVQDTSEPPAVEPIRSTVSLDSVRPSADPNRGHDATAPETAKPRRAARSEAAAAAPAASGARVEPVAGASAPGPEDLF